MNKRILLTFAAVAFLAIVLNLRAPVGGGGAVIISPGGGGAGGQAGSQNLTNWSNVATNSVQFTNASLFLLSTNNGSALTNLNASNLASGTVPGARLPLLTNSITATFDGGGAVLATNVTRVLSVQDNSTITGFTMTTDVSSLTVVEVMRFTYDQYDAGSTHPAIGDKITASLPPTIGPSLFKTNVASVATWSANLTNGNYIAFRTITNSAATWITLTLKVEHTP